MFEFIDYLFILIYLMLVVIIGFKSSKQENSEEYLIANRNLNTFSSAMTIAASKIGAGLLLTYTALVYLYGLSAIWFFIGMIIGYISFYFFAKKIKRLSDNKKYYTLSDFFFDKYGNIAGYISSIIVFITMFGWVIVNFIGGAKILESFTNISFELSTIIVGIIILIYLILGGFKAVVKTDVIQLFGIFLLFFLMIYLLLTNSSSIQSADLNLFNMSVGNIVTFFLLGIFFPMASAELWQRIYAIKDEKTLKKSLLVASSLYILIGIILLFVGLIIKSQLPNINSDNSLVIGLSSLLPVGLSGLGVIVFCSAVMSSADTYLFTSNSSLVQNIINKSKRVREKQLLKLMRITMILLMLIAVILAIFLKSVIDTTSIFASLMFSLGFLVIVLWIFPSLNKISINLSLIFGFFGVLVIILLKGIGTFLVMYSLGLTIAGLVLGLIINQILK